jgi:hypothetical protein
LKAENLICTISSFVCTAYFCRNYIDVFNYCFSALLGLQFFNKSALIKNFAKAAIIITAKSGIAETIEKSDQEIS